MAKNKTIYNSLTRAAGEVKEGREINIRNISLTLCSPKCVCETRGGKYHEL